MAPGTTYTEEDLKRQVKLLSNIMKDDVYRDVLQRAIEDRIILQSFDGFQRRIYVRPNDNRAVQGDLFVAREDAPPF
jgi:hypothetical protein